MIRKDIQASLIIISPFHLFSDGESIKMTYTWEWSQIKIALRDPRTTLIVAFFKWSLHLLMHLTGFVDTPPPPTPDIGTSTYQYRNFEPKVK